MLTHRYRIHRASLRTPLYQQLLAGAASLNLLRVITASFLVMVTEDDVINRSGYPAVTSVASILTGQPPQAKLEHPHESPDLYDALSCRPVCSGSAAPYAPLPSHRPLLRSPSRSLAL